MRDIKIVVATHKKYYMPTDDMYVPIHVGSMGKPSLGYQRDDEGENISAKNDDYCELTALYWAWKNMKADYIGLNHYRRYFAQKDGLQINGKFIATKEYIVDVLGGGNILLPKARNYYIETVYSQYIHAHRKSDMDLVKEIISKKYPLYCKSLDRMKEISEVHLYNMFIMRWDYFDAYCTWLFDILFTLEAKLKGNHEPRLFGYIGERLLDVWLEANQHAYKESNIVFLGKQHWMIKSGRFLQRKIKGYFK